MVNETENPTPIEEPASEAEVTQNEVPDAPEPLDPSRLQKELEKVRSEAAQRRNQQKKLEHTVTQQTATIEALQWQLIDAALPPDISPQLFRKLGPTAAELSHEDGSINHDAVIQAAANLVRDYEISRRGYSTIPDHASYSIPNSGPRPDKGMFAAELKKKVGGYAVN